MNEGKDENPLNWEAFHNTTREYVVFLLLFIFLYMDSYFIICLFRKKWKSYPDCYEDAFASRISLWLSSFSLSVSIGAALLLPMSIISNEVLLLYPNSYYVQWLNSSLIQESEGFPGSSKGIMARINEALLVLALTGLVIMGIIYMISAILDSESYIQPALNISSYYLPFLYSCVSFLGVLMLLLCTPFGFARLFSVVADLLTKPKTYLEKSDSCIETSKSLLPVDKDTKLNDTMQHFKTDSKLHHRVFPHENKHEIYALENLSKARLKYLGDEFSGQPQCSVPSFRKHCLYPFVMLLLLLLTMLSVLTVSQNTLELCFGIKSLQLYSQTLSLGITSLSTMGPLGAFLEIIMILYLWWTSIVGLYSLPVFCHLKPKLSSTSLTQVIGNCAVLLILSSALPVLARSLGITNFDLLGDFGRINWLGNFYIVLFHNLVFAVSVAICLGKKMYSSLYPQLIQFFRTLFYNGKI